MYNLLDREVVLEGDEIFKPIYQWVKVSDEVGYSAAIEKYPIRRNSLKSVERNDSGSVASEQGTANSAMDAICDTIECPECLAEFTIDCECPICKGHWLRRKRHQ
jgi:hypothetical protein